MRFACLLSMICAIAYGFQHETNSEEAARDKEVYAIYSLMMTNPPTTFGEDNNQRYLIAATTVPGSPEQPCVSPPKERETDFREVLADFARRKATPRQLKRALSISKPYVLLTAADVKEFMNERGGFRTSPEVANQQFRGATNVFMLTDVYFNERRTLALTAIHTWCGGLCGLDQWVVLEKLETGKWEGRPWVLCRTMSENFDKAALRSSANSPPPARTGHASSRNHPYLESSNWRNRSPSFVSEVADEARRQP